MKGQAMSTYADKEFRGGFTKVPHPVFERLLVLNLSKRELEVLLLVIRLTYGCRSEWAVLQQADLIIVGISAGHAKAVLDSLIAKRVLVKKGRNQYKHHGFVEYGNKTTYRLNKLIRDHSYRKGNINVTEVVTTGLPEQQDNSYLTSNNDKLPNRELLRSVDSDDHSPKDTKTFIKDNEKDSRITVHPTAFSPRNEYEVAALESWQELEPHNPNSFARYLHLAKLGLPVDVFYRLVSEVKQDETNVNKFALFNKKAFEYLYTGKSRKVGGNV